VGPGVKIGPAFGGSRADLIEHDLAVAGGIEGFLDPRGPGRGARFDVVFLGDEVIAVGGREIEQQDLGHGTAPYSISAYLPASPSPRPSPLGVNQGRN
jgi:hypothetical protein